MGKRLMALLVGVATLAVVVGGCGSSGDEATAAKPLTKAQYVKQGSAICAKEGEKMGDKMTAFGKTHDLSAGKGGKKDGEELVETVLIPSFRDEVEGLEELTPPAADEKQVEAMLEKFNTGLDEGEDDPSSLFTNSEFSKGTEAAEKYGLKGCGTLFL